MYILIWRSLYVLVYLYQNKMCINDTIVYNFYIILINYGLFVISHRFHVDEDSLLVIYFFLSTLVRVTSWRGYVKFFGSGPVSLDSYLTLIAINKQKKENLTLTNIEMHNIENLLYAYYSNAQKMTPLRK